MTLLLLARFPRRATLRGSLLAISFRLFFVTGLVLGLSGRATAQAPANDDALGAVLLPVTATCQPTAATNVGATTSARNGYVNPGSCGIAASPKDVWFRFMSPAASSQVLVAVSGSAAGTVRVFASPPGSAGPFFEQNCGSGGSANTVAPPLRATNLLPNRVYYINVAGYTSFDTTGPFTICVTDAPACGDPTGLRLSNYNSGTGAGTFTFTPGAGNVSYLATYTSGGTTQPVSPAPTGSPFTIPGLSPSSFYTVTLTATCGNGGQSSPIRITFSTPRTNNDEPANAIPLPINATCQPFGGSNVGATGTTPNGYTNGTNPATCGGAVPTAFLKDVWFTFTTPASGAGSTGVVFDLTSSIGTSYLAGRVFSTAGGAAGPFTSIICFGANGPTTIGPLLPSTTYYVSIANTFGIGTTEGNFTLCLTAPITCAAPTNLLLSNILTTSATVSFMPGVGNTSYTVTATPQGGGPAVVVTPPPTASPVQLTGLAPGTAYTVTVQADCGANGTTNGVSVPLTTAAGIPANDLCSGAMALRCGQTLASTTLGASSTGDPMASCGLFYPAPSGLPSVWYSIVGTGGPITLSTCAGPTPTPGSPQLLVYTGTCGSLTCLTSNDGTGTNCTGNGAVVTFGSSPGTTYYVLVQYTVVSLNAGPFGLQVTCPLGTQPAALAEQVTLFPNPATGTATLAVPAGLLAQPAALALYNALGQVVQARDVPAAPAATRLPLDLRGLPAGVYSVRLATEQGPVTKRLVVE